MIDRRSFLSGMLLAATAPGIVRASSLMAISPLDARNPYLDRMTIAEYWRGIEATETATMGDLMGRASFMFRKFSDKPEGFNVHADDAPLLVGRPGLVSGGAGDREGVQLDAGEGAED